jgi:hypothetical protein
MLWAHKALRIFSDCLIDDSIDDDDRKYFVAAWASTHSRSRSRGARALRTPFAPSRSSSSATTHEDGRAARRSQEVRVLYEMVLDGWCHRAPARPKNSIVEFICTTRLAAASALFARGSLSIKRSARCSWWRARTSGSLPCPPTRRVRRRSLGNRSTRSHCHIHAKPHHPEAAARHAQMAYASSRRRRRHGLPRHMWPLR